MPLFTRKQKTPFFLRGGARHNTKRRNLSQLISLLFKKKGTHVKEIKYGAYLGGGMEGRVEEAEVTIEKNGKTRIVKLAAKKFRPKDPRMPKIEYMARPITDNPDTIYGRENAHKHFNILNELIKLNRQKKLGLNLPSTVRIMYDKKQRRWIVFTTLQEIYFIKAVTSISDVYYEDMKRQIETLHENGFSVTANAFFPAVDKKTFAPLNRAGSLQRIRVPSCDGTIIFNI